MLNKTIIIINNKINKILFSKMTQIRKQVSCNTINNIIKIIKSKI